MTRPARPAHPARRARLALAAAALACVSLLATGCTVSRADDDPSPSTGGEAAASEDTATPAPGVEASPTPTGPDSEELSADVFAAAAEAASAAPLASRTVQVPAFPGSGSGAAEATVVVDVLELERLDDATLLTVALSSPDPGTKIENNALDTDRNSEFFDRFGLEDRTNGVRYLPLSWRRIGTDEVSATEVAEQPFNSCVCLYRASNFTLGPDPIVMSSLYGPLPEGVDTVSLTAPGGLEVADLPVG